MGKSNVIVVDGANIAYIEPSKKGDPKVSNITSVVSLLKEKGYQPIVIIDASLHHKVDDPEQLDALINERVIRQAPAGTDADYFVLEVADENNANVVSNDRFEPYQKDFPWIKERRIPLMIVNGEVELYDPKLKGKQQSK